MDNYWPASENFWFILKSTYIDGAIHPAIYTSLMIVHVNVNTMTEEKAGRRRWCMSENHTLCALGQVKGVKGVQTLSLGVSDQKKERESISIDFSVVLLQNIKNK